MSTIVTARITIWLITVSALALAGALNQFRLARRLARIRSPGMTFADVRLDLRGAMRSDIGRSRLYEAQMRRCRLENYAFGLILITIALAVAIRLD